MAKGTYRIKDCLGLKFHHGREKVSTFSCYTESSKHQAEKANYKWHKTFQWCTSPNEVTSPKFLKQNFRLETKYSNAPGYAGHSHHTGEPRMSLSRIPEQAAMRLGHHFSGLISRVLHNTKYSLPKGPSVLSSPASGLPRSCLTGPTPQMLFLGPSVPLQSPHLHREDNPCPNYPHIHNVDYNSKE